jgi:prepilin-type N-terminal cleavage/methylation domain-containing protein
MTPGWPSACLPSSARRDTRGAPGLRRSAFTLLEVMIAIAMLFIAGFAILDLVSQNLRAARMLQQSGVSAAPLAAELTLTNKLEEGTAAGDFGERYPGYTWTRDLYIVGTNGLWQADFFVFGPDDRRTPVSQMSILLFNGGSAAGLGQPFRRVGNPGGRR